MNNDGRSFFEVWRAIKSSGNRLSSMERWVLTVLLGFVNFHHPDGVNVWPKDLTIAEQAGVSRRTVRACRASFQSKGLITWDRKPGGSNSTFIDLNAILDLADDTANGTNNEEE